MLCYVTVQLIFYFFYDYFSFIMTYKQLIGSLIYFQLPPPPLLLLLLYYLIATIQVEVGAGMRSGRTCRSHRDGNTSIGTADETAVPNWIGVVLKETTALDDYVNHSIIVTNPTDRVARSFELTVGQVLRTWTAVGDCGWAEVALGTEIRIRGNGDSSGCYCC